MSAPAFTMRQLLEAGVHYGHTTRRWNPKMEPYIFGARNGIHIINLEETVPMLHQALDVVRSTVAGGGRVLFVGTKSQASQVVKEAAKKCGQYYINHRWLGGMLTNWKTVNQSIKRLVSMEEQLNDPALRLTKKERLGMQRAYDKLELAIGGIREMGGLPDILFVIDTNKEAIAIQEAQRLGIPVVAVIDSNSNPDGIAYPVPGNDDALRAINLYCDLVVETVLDGLQAEITASGADIGASVDVPAEVLPAEATPAAEKAPTKKAATKKAAEPKAEEEPAAKKAPAKKAAAKKADAPKAEEKKPAAKKAPAKKAEATEAKK